MDLKDKFKEAALKCKQAQDTYNKNRLRAKFVEPEEIKPKVRETPSNSLDFVVHQIVQFKRDNPIGYHARSWRPGKRAGDFAKSLQVNRPKLEDSTDTERSLAPSLSQKETILAMKMMLHLLPTRNII